METKKIRNTTSSETSKAPVKSHAEPAKIRTHSMAMPLIEARIDRLVDSKNSKVKAFASATIGPFAVHELRVIQGDNGMFVAMPSVSFQKNGKTEYHETFHPCSNDARVELNNAVLQAFEQKVAEKQLEDSPSNDEEAHTQSM